MMRMGAVEVMVALSLMCGGSRGGMVVPEYREHSIESLCMGSEGEKVELALNNKPTLLTLNYSRALTLRCHLELELHSNQFGFSVFTEQMNLAEAPGCGEDFYQFGRDFLVFTSHKGPKRCGAWQPARRVLREDGTLLRLDYAGTPRSKREYVEDVDKEMDIWLAVHPPRRGEAPKQLRLVVTPFKKHCSGDDHYYRRCPSSSGQCIKRELFCDGQINCGGEEKDEQIEYCLKNRGGDLAMTIPIIILIVVFSIVGLMFLLFLLKTCSSHLSPKRHSSSPSEHRTAEQSLSLCPQATAREGRGLRALQAQLSSPPTAPDDSPALPSLPPSYSEAVSSPCTPLYPCDPPKYTELPEGGTRIANS